MTFNLDITEYENAAFKQPNNQTGAKIMSNYIAKIREYYAGQTNLMGVTLVTDDNGFEPLEFDSIAAARDKVEELDDETYVTANGEAGRPTYYIIDEACRAWLELDDTSKYDWNDYAGADDDNAQHVYMREQDERYVKSHAINPDDAGVWVVCDDEIWCNSAMVFRENEVPTQRNFAMSAGFDNADELPDEPLPTVPLAEYLESVDYRTGNLIVDDVEAENAVKTIIAAHDDGEEVAK